MKTNKGTIVNWYRVTTDIMQGGKKNSLGFFVQGNFSRFNGRFGHTSPVIDVKGTQIETENSLYTLIGNPLYDGKILTKEDLDGFQRD